MADRTHVHAALAVAAGLLAFHATPNIAELPVLLSMIAGALTWFVVDRFTGNVSGVCPECGKAV